MSTEYIFIYIYMYIFKYMGLGGNHMLTGSQHVLPTGVSGGSAGPPGAPWGAPGGPGGPSAGPHDQYSHGRGAVVALVGGCLGGLFKAFRLVSLSEVGAGLSIM